MIDWRKAPAWANFHTFDVDGRGQWHATRPAVVAGQLFWSQGGRAWPRAYEAGYPAKLNWRDSWEERLPPSEKSEEASP